MRLHQRSECTVLHWWTQSRCLSAEQTSGDQSSCELIDFGRAESANKSHFRSVMSASPSGHNCLSDFSFHSPPLLLLCGIHVLPNRNNFRLWDSLLFFFFFFFFYPWHLLASFIVFLHVSHMFDLVFKSLKTSYVKSLSAAMRIKDLRYI